MPMMNGHIIGVGEEPAYATQVVTYTGTAAASAAFGAETRWVRVHTDGICSLKFSAAATAATVNDARMAAGATEYWGVVAGSAMKVSAIVNT